MDTKVSVLSPTFTEVEISESGTQVEILSFVSTQVVVVWPT